MQHSSESEVCVPDNALSSLYISPSQHSAIHLNPREIEFLQLACTELTYKEVADRMFLSPRTIDGYRDILFEKLNVKTRVGLVLFAIRNGIVSV